MNMKSSIDRLEVEKFSQLSTQWWNKNGPLKTLHDINPPRLAFIEQYMSLKGCRLLDVGCGGGILSEAMAKKGARVIGLDVESEAIQSAKAHALSEQVELEYVCEPIEHFEAEAFDAITCMEMLEHVSDPNLVIRHCARLLKPNGLLFLSTINRTLSAYASAIVGAEYVLGLLPRQTHDFEKFIKPSELSALVRAHHMKPMGISGLSYNPLTRISSLQSSVSVNYLLVCQKQ